MNLVAKKVEITFSKKQQQAILSGKLKEFTRSFPYFRFWVGDWFEIEGKIFVIIWEENLSSNKVTYHFGRQKDLMFFHVHDNMPGKCTICGYVAGDQSLPVLLVSPLLAFLSFWRLLAC